VTETYLIRLHPDADRASVVSTLSTQGTVQQFSAIPLLLGWDTASTTAEAWVQSIPGVRSVQRDSPEAARLDIEHLVAVGIAGDTGQLPIISSGQKPGDLDFNSVYDLIRPGQAAVFDYDPTVGVGNGTGVNFYIVDSGIEGTHPEFTGRFGGRLYDGYPGDPLWFHGMACATGGVGSTRGVAPGATLYDSRCFPTVGGAPVSYLVAGINAAVSHFTGQSNPGVMSCSWSSFGSDVYGAAIDAAVDAGIPVFCSAGNDAQSLDFGTDLWPAEDPDAITVGAIDGWRRRLNISNYGAAVDLYARGDAWTAARPGDDWFSSMGLRGTSFCCPMAAGMMARMLTGTTKMTSRAQVEAARADFMADYTVEDVLNLNGSKLTGAKRLYIPGVSLTGFAPYSGPTTGIPASFPIEVDVARKHAILGAVSDEVSTRFARTHIIVET
jgi:subtilisin family serine protease